MSKRSEEASKEIFKDGIELFGRRDKNNNLVIHPETMVGILRNAAQRGYEQAEQDLALTWEDIRTICLLTIGAEVVRDNQDLADNVQEKLEQVFYEDVLRRFREMKDK